MLALDWQRDRQWVLIDFATLSKKELDIPLGSWVEQVVGVPEDNAAFIIYKNEIVYFKV